MGKVTILEETPKDPISLMGRMAGVAYGADTSDPEKNYKRGLNCIKSGHHKVLEYADVFMILDGYSIRVMREFGRHQAGMPTYLQSSTRYINYKNFKYNTPLSIRKNPKASIEYMSVMGHIRDGYEKLLELDIPKEDIAMMLPLAADTSISAKYNARTLMGMAEERLCMRAYHEYRQLMADLIVALGEYSPEWNKLIDMVFKCKCIKKGYCEEEFSCGMRPMKDDIVIVTKEKYHDLLENQK